VRAAMRGKSPCLQDVALMRQAKVVYMWCSRTSVSGSDWDFGGSSVGSLCEAPGLLKGVGTGVPVHCARVNKKILRNKSGLFKF